jgi:cysteine-rich repeat protein
MRQIYTGRGAWVWFAIAALNSLACALDLAQRRATPSPSLYSEPVPSTNNHRYHFKTPLRADLAPLCGNGRLDTLADYEQYNKWNATVEYRLKVNEVCDDGNRLDGDGCAADCASLDGFTSPCPLALAVDSALRFVGFVNAETLVLVTPTQKLYANAETLQTYGATTLPYQDVVSGFIDSGSKTLWLHSRAGVVWSDKNASQTLSVDASPVGIWAVSENGDALLLTSAGQLVDVRRLRVKKVWQQADPTDVLHAVVPSLMEDGTSMRLQCTFQGAAILQRVFTYQSTTGALSEVEVTPPTADTEKNFETGHLWAHLFISTIFNNNPRILQASAFEPRYAINTNPAIRDNAFAVQATPWIVGFNILSPRDMLNSNQQSFYMVGDPEFFEKYKHPEFLVCNGTYTPCILDVPLCFDPLAPNPYAVNRAQETMYTALVEAAKGASKWSEVPARAQMRLGCTPEVAHQALTHPVTGALWIVRGSQVFEVGRRGTQYKLANGQCLPSHSGRACPVGRWASTTSLSCADCAVNASLYNGTLAWKQQCSTSTVVSKGRRLLAAEEAKQTIQLIYVSTRTDILSAGDAASLLRRAVNDGVCTCMATAVGGTWRVAYACILTELKSPSDALRALRSIVVPGVQDFVAPPSVGWSRSAETSANNKDEGPSVGVIVGATAAGVLGVVLVVGLFVWVLHRPSKYQPVAATTNHS